jgi:CRISPR/Cas system CSM-associated protein Csm4 (group 5 of RAMP superfamily)
VSPLTSITIISGATINSARMLYGRDKKIATIRNNNNCKKLLQLYKIIELMLGFLVIVW